MGESHSPQLTKIWRKYLSLAEQAEGQALFASNAEILRCLILLYTGITWAVYYIVSLA